VLRRQNTIKEARQMIPELAATEIFVSMFSADALRPALKDLPASAGTFPV
jgi:hypothetical protein